MIAQKNAQLVPTHWIVSMAETGIVRRKKTTHTARESKMIASDGKTAAKAEAKAGPDTKISHAERNSHSGAMKDVEMHVWKQNV